MKTLVIVSHPDIHHSVINKRWIKELNKYPERYVIHQLYEVYPDQKINVPHEQQMIETFDQIIFQFPFYCFSCPSLLKKWFDEVITYGWAYGSKSGYKFGNKKIALAITAGIDEKEFCATGQYEYTIKELTVSFELTFRYVRADYKGCFTYYGVNHNASPEWIENSVAQYINFTQTFA